MVRTHPPVVPLQLEVSRVLGWSTALAIHLLALMLLLIPAAYVGAPTPRERVRVPMLIPPPPKPIELPPRHHEPDFIKPAPPKTVISKPAPLPPPTATVEDQLAVPPLPAGEIQTPTLAPADPTPPAGAGEGVQLQYRSAPPPAYPIQAIRDHQQGTVLLRVRVEADGKASSVTIERSSGSRALDNAARQQVLRHWRFVPAKVDGQLVPADGLVPVSFSLPD